MAGQRLTQILQTYLDLKLHLLLDANHLFGAAHLPDALVACLYHLGQGGHIRSACQVFPATTVTSTSSLIEVLVLSSAQSGTKWDTSQTKRKWPFFSARMEKERLLQVDLSHTGDAQALYFPGRQSGTNNAAIP